MCVRERERQADRTQGAFVALPESLRSSVAEMEVFEGAGAVAGGSEPLARRLPSSVRYLSVQEYMYTVTSVRNGTKIARGEATDYD